METVDIRNILMGAGGSATQIDGGDLGHTWNLWYTAGKIKDGADPALAVDHWNKWREDTMLMARMGNKREEIVPVLEDVQTALRDLALLKRTENAPLCFYTDRDEALAICDRASLQAILGLADRVETCRRSLLRNANVRLSLITLFLMNH